MQVSAINAINFTGKNQVKNNKMSSNSRYEGEKNTNVSNKAMRNATKALMLAGLMSLGSAGFTSCDKYDFDDTHIYEVQIPVDTVHEHHYYPVPGTNTVDTVKIKTGYDAEPAPILKDFFEDNGIDTGDGKIITRMMYLDEYNHPFVKALFTEDKSSKKEMWYNVTTTDFDEDEGEYIEGKNQNFYQVGYSTPDRDHQLVVKLLKLKSPNLDKNNELNYVPVSKALYDVKEMKRYTLDEDGNAVYDGEFTNGDIAKSIMFVNEFGAKRRYSSIEIESETPKDVIIEDQTKK